MSTWLRDIAGWLVSERAEKIPDEALHAASLRAFDTVICAIGGREHEAAEAMLAVLRELGGAGKCSILGLPDGASPIDAILANGTFIRALDCNDFEVRGGVIYGHPSDNYAPALAMAEYASASGREFLRAILLGYELYWRVLANIFRTTGGRAWDHTSVSGLAAGAIGGLLLGLDEVRLSEAMAIGGCQSYSLAGLRQGEISALKASANARTASAGALGALLARQGVTGPSELFEGKGGLLAAFGIDPTPDLLKGLAEPVGPHWHLLDVSFKPYPSISTSQGLVAATLEVAQRDHPTAADIEHVEVRVVDSQTTRDHIADPARANPTTRETADHSLPFLVAAGLEDAELGVAQFEGERWHRPSTRGLMARVQIVPDSALNQHAANTYPAVITVTMRSGAQLRSEMLDVPGSPNRPLTSSELLAKARRVSKRPPSEVKLRELEAACMALPQAPNLTALAALLRSL